MPVFVDNLLVFGRLLRAAGFDVPVGSMLDLVDALGHVDVRVRTDVFHTCRTILVRRHEQLPAFTAIFDAFWRDHTNPFGGRGASANVRDTREHRAAAAAILGIAVPDETGGEDRETSQLATLRTWSDAERLAHKDFAEFTDEELARARVALDRLAWIPGQRRTRRWVRGRGARIDMRGALARSLRTGGDLLTLPTRRRLWRPRRLVLLCDISGSMERYSRLLLHFAHGVGQRHRRLEVFLFATGLTRVTRQLRPRNLDRAAAAVTAAVPDWSAGTRIGFALQQFHRHWSRRVMRGGAVVLIVSDGWDRGDPVLLQQQVARLQRSCHRLIWLNPLIGTAGFEPLTRALQAAKPFVDEFLPARTLSDLGELALHLETLSRSTPPRRRQRRA